MIVITEGSLMNCLSGGAHPKFAYFAIRERALRSHRRRRRLRRRGIIINFLHGGSKNPLVNCL